MPRQIGEALVAEDLAVDFQIRDGPALLAPKRVPAERAVLRFEVFLPQRGRLDDVAAASNTAKSLVIIRSSYGAAQFGYETLVEKSDARYLTR